MLKNTKITTKILFVVAFGLLSLFISVALQLSALKQTMTQDRREAIQHVVEVGVSIAKFYHGEFQAGRLSEDAAREAAKSAIRAMRYGSGDYLFVYNTNGVTEVHGTRKELEGKQRLEEKDSTGFAFIRNQIANAQRGGGFTVYNFTKPNAGDAVFEKISYDAPFQPWNWVVASGVYVDDIDTSFRHAVLDSLWTLIAVAVAMVAVSLAISRTVTQPIGAIVAAMRRLAAGDLDTPVTGRERGDEIGRMAEAVEVFKGNALAVERLRRENQDAQAKAAADRHRELQTVADSAEREVKSIAHQIVDAATKLKSTSSSLASIVTRTTDSSDNALSAASDAENGINVVAAASEELSSSIRSISAEISRSAKMSRDAVEQTRHTGKIVTDLNAAASRIGDVVKLINSIASQTNLLALNATIEAARAGDAGRGFAVVAGEVKNLAGQTAQATDEIGEQIGSIQASTQAAVDAIEKAIASIEGINTAVTSVASAVEQQGAATGEIARNVHEAASGAGRVVENVNGVQNMARETNDESLEVKTAADELLQHAEALTVRMDRFIGGIRAA